MKWMIFIAALAATPITWADTAASGMQAASPVAQAPLKPQPTALALAAKVKQRIQNNLDQLRGYQWIETTTISKGGEQKMRRKAQCYYNSIDGSLMRTPIVDNPNGGEWTFLGDFGFNGEVYVVGPNKQLSPHMKEAEALLQAYVPPYPGLIQQALDAGNVSLELLQNGSVGQLAFRDYLVPGDTLGVGVEMQTLNVVGLVAYSYIESPANVVKLVVDVGTLPDGTLYPSRTQLTEPSREIGVEVVNTDYQPYP